MKRRRIPTDKEGADQDTLETYERALQQLHRYTEDPVEAFEVRDWSDFDTTADVAKFDFVTTFDAIYDQAQPFNMKILLLGNAGAGKTTFAHRLMARRPVPRLSLDEIAWAQAAERKPIEESLQEMHRFFEDNPRWIVEGCYGDLVEAALPYCTELYFLNPGVDVCVEHCLRRSWEPTKYASPEAQEAMLSTLIAWVKEYKDREDEYGLKCHRRIFEGFAGAKMEFTSVASYARLQCLEPGSGRAS